METELVFPRKAFVTVTVVIHLIELLIHKRIHLTMDMQKKIWIYRLKNNHSNNHRLIFGVVCQALLHQAFSTVQGLFLQNTEARFFFSLSRQSIAKNGHASTKETPQILKEDGGEEGRERRKENTKVSTGGENPYGRVTDLLTKTTYDFLFFL